MMASLPPFPSLPMHLPPVSTAPLPPTVNNPNPLLSPSEALGIDAFLNGFEGEGEDPTDQDRRRMDQNSYSMLGMDSRLRFRPQPIASQGQQQPPYLPPPPPIFSSPHHSHGSSSSADASPLHPFLAPPETPAQKHEREQKMKQQAQELSAWMDARGITGAQAQSLGGAVMREREREQTFAGEAQRRMSRTAEDYLASLEASQKRAAKLPPPPLAPLPQNLRPSSSHAPTVSSQRTLTPPEKASTSASTSKLNALPKVNTKVKQKVGKASGVSSSTEGKKSGLLSLEQKRANHIASEQKRRAAIKQSYDRLCCVIPTLSGRAPSTGEEVKEEDMDEEKGTSKRKRKKPDDSPAVPTGRQGSKSEAVVLSKTVHYIESQIHHRQALLDHLAFLHSQAQKKGMHISAGRRVWDEPWADGDEGTDESGSGTAGEGSDGDDSAEMEE